MILSFAYTIIKDLARNPASFEEGAYGAWSQTI
jgi:hypothetical protein